MITIQRNGEIVNLDYIVENNLIPPVSDIKNILKKILFTQNLSKIASRNNGIYLNDVFNGEYIGPGIFRSGYLVFKDIEDTQIGMCRLLNPYSGNSTVLGSINERESYNCIINGRVNTKLVVDFPTHSCNGSIKYIELIPNLDLYNKNNLLYSDIIYSGEFTTNTCIYNDDIYRYSYMSREHKNIIYNDDIYILNDISSIPSDLYSESSSSTRPYLPPLLYFDNKINLASGTTNKFYPVELNHIEKTYSFLEPITLKFEDSISQIINVIDYNNNKYAIATVSTSTRLYKLDESENIFKRLSSVSSQYNSSLDYCNIVPINGKLLFNVNNYDYIIIDLNIESIKLLSDIRNHHNILNNLEYKDYYKSGLRSLANDSSSFYEYNNELYYFFHTSSGESNQFTNFYIFKQNPDRKVPLKITLNTPIEKTQEQTLKIELYIDII